MLPALLSLAALAAAAPLVERQAINDVQILNYALTLEHLENAFYRMGLSNFTREEFIAAGRQPPFYNNLKKIKADEQTHVDFLSAELGDQAVQECTYAFPVTSPATFLTVANLLEGVGVSAYLGAAQFITDKTYLTAAGSVLAVEARHSAYLRAQAQRSPFPSAFDTPLTFNQVFSLATQFIVSCPESNPALPVMAFPAIAASPATPAKVGAHISLEVAESVDAQAAWFITILGPVSATLSGSGTSYTVDIPEGAPQGQAYVVLTGDASPPTDDNTVAGPAIIEIIDNVTGSLPLGPPHKRPSPPKGQSDP